MNSGKFARRGCTAADRSKYVFTVSLLHSLPRCPAIRKITDFTRIYQILSFALCGLSLSVKLMHSLRLPGVPPFPPSIKRHRFDSDHSRFSLNLSLSKPIPTPFWACLPSPPMSGPPTPERPTEPPQAAGRRRKRSDSPATGAPSPAGTPVVAGAIIVSESRAERHGEVAVTTGISRQPATWPTPYPDPQSYGFGAGATGLPGPAISSFEPQYGAGSSSPESKRRRKVHVPSACVNCKKKHLRCDNSRPCHRCIQTGQEVGLSISFAVKSQLTGDHRIVVLMFGTRRGDVPL